MSAQVRVREQAWVLGQELAQARVQAPVPAQALVLALVLALNCKHRYTNRDLHPRIIPDWCTNLNVDYHRLVEVLAGAWFLLLAVVQLPEDCPPEDFSIL